LDIDSDAFRLMYHTHAAIEGLHGLRDTIGFIAKARLPIGRDGRNRPSLFPFGTATGRNAHTKSPYNAHAGMRSFMVFPPDAIGFYLGYGVLLVDADRLADFNDAPIVATKAQQGHTKTS
jgi:hypothetical protein